jgi:obg-like ATPase 1
MFSCQVPAFLNVVDIAGLVKGASEGQGLGNAFLSHIKACDAIFYMARAFEQVDHEALIVRVVRVHLPEMICTVFWRRDDDVTHVEGDVNPVRDMDIILEELRKKDEEFLLKEIDKIEKNVIRGDKKNKAEYDMMVKFKECLVDEKRHLRFHEWNEKVRPLFHFKSAGTVETSLQKLSGQLRLRINERMIFPCLFIL